MNDFEQEWDLAMALEVLTSPDVDSATWAAAVKWLLFYGPPALRELIGQASHFATSDQFPALTPAGYDGEGQPCYEVGELARALGMSEEELGRQMATLAEETGQPELVAPARVQKPH